jgi:mannose-6-phosphate isomerase-like protein (cupin superfamily)
MSTSKGVRRVVTSHDATNKAFALFDGDTPHRMVREGSGTVAHMIWVTDGSPADMTGDKDSGGTMVGTAPPAHGSVCRVVDFPPAGDTSKLPNDAMQSHLPAEFAVPKAWPPSHPFMHRTRTIDYAIVLDGEIDMVMDDSEVHLKAGDILVQQGTNHAWVNRGDKFCRICFVLIDAEEPLK